MFAARRALERFGALALLLGLFGGALAGPIGWEHTAFAATPHRAAVIVDTGDGVHRVVITFTEDSITGIDALRRANADPVVYAFNGQGGAVCRLFGVGRDAGPDCLGGQDGDSRYWAYFRAPAGTSSFTYSRVGAGSSQVRDGDVEGWKFGTGAAPEFVSLQSLLPRPLPPGPGQPTPPVIQAPAPGSNPSEPNGSTPRSAASATSGAQPGTGTAASPSTLPVTGESGANAGGANGKGASRDASRANGSREQSSDADGSSRRKESTQTALASSTSDSGSSATSLIWFGLLLAAIVIAIVIARRVRRRSI